MLPDAVDFAFGTLLKKQVLKGGGSGLMTFSYGAMETRRMLQKPGCPAWRRRQDDLRMQQTIIWAKEMGLRRAEEAPGNEIGCMLDSSQWKQSLALLLEIVVVGY